MILLFGVVYTDPFCIIRNCTVQRTASITHLTSIISFKVKKKTKKNKNQKTLHYLTTHLQYILVNVYSLMIITIITLNN